MSDYIAMLHEAEAELKFVGDRYLADGSGVRFTSGRCTGVSADALAWYAVSVRGEPVEGEYPRDPSDLAACERTLEMAPVHLRERMAPVIEKYRAAVARAYPGLA